MARRMVLTVGLLVEAALEDRMRQALKGHEAILPAQQDTRLQHPTARGVVHSGVGMHRLDRPHHWPIGLHLTAEHPPLLPLLGQR